MYVMLQAYLHFMQFLIILGPRTWPREIKLVRARGCKRLVDGGHRRSFAGSSFCRCSPLFVAANKDAPRRRGIGNRLLCIVFG